MVFIVIDGLDASGKSTQAHYLNEFLERKGKTVVLRVHPSDDNYFGRKARDFLNMRGKGAHFASAFFYMLDVIRSVLLYSWQNYDYTVFVRYLMGTAYLPTPFDRVGYRFFAAVVPTSNLMFFLDVPPENAEERLKESRSRLEMFENLEELKKIRKKALNLALMDNWRIIHAEKPINEVQAEIQNVLCGSLQKQEIV